MEKVFDRRNFLQAVAAVVVGSADFRLEYTADVVGQPSKVPSGDATIADILVDNLIEWDVTHVFGIVVEDSAVALNRILFIGVRHDEAAAFIACGWAKHTIDNRII